MTGTQVDALAGLQEWYAAHVNGNWEHTYGVSIGTLDNPGWVLKIDLIDTELVNCVFNEVKHQGSEDIDWYHCRVAGNVFEAFSGPRRLVDVIVIFLQWAARSSGVTPTAGNPG